MRNLRRVSEYAAKRKKQNTWRNIVTFVAAVVVFCTTYALILPAITMEQEGLSCGLTEHVHTADCYQLVCGKQEIFSHTHTKPGCYDANGNLTCTLKEQTLHHHGPDCYSKPQPVCGVQEYAPHAHGEECYTDGALTCTLAETQGHSHSESCYPSDFTPELICGKQDVEEHRHSDACYRRICELEEHTHTEACAGSHEAFLENLVNTQAAEETLAGEENRATEPAQPTEGEQATQPAQPTEGEQATQPEQPTEGEQATQPQQPTEGEQPTEDEQPTQPEEDGNEEDGPENAPDMLPMLTAARSTPMNLTEVATGIKSESSPTEYDPTTERFKIGLNMEFTFRTVEVNGKRFITNGQTDADGNLIDCGLNFTMCLGEMGVDADVLSPAIHDLMDGSKRAGTYTLVMGADKKVYMTVALDSDYVAGSGDTIDAKLNLSGSVGKDKADKDGKVELPMDGEVKLVVNPDDVTYPEGTTKDGYMAVTKTGSYLGSDKKLSYKVNITTNDKGTPGKIQLEDTMQITGVDVEGLDSILLDGNPLPADQYVFTNNGGSLSISVKDIDGLQAWQNHTVEYVYRLRDELPNGTMVNNSVKASSEPDGGGKKLEVSKTVTTTAFDDDDPSSPLAPKLVKRSDWNDSLLADANPVIPWTIEINENKKNLSGKTLEDEMLKQIAAGTGVTVQVDGQDVTDFSQYFDIDYTTGKVTFKEASNGHKITLSYCTPAPGDFGNWGEHEVKNTAKLGNKIISESKAKSDQGKVQKENTDISLDADGRVVMDWTVTIDIARDGMPLDESIMDFTHPYYTQGNGNHFYDKNSVELYYHGTKLDADYYELKFYENSNNQTEVEDCSILEIVMKKDPSASENMGLIGNDQLVVKYKTYTAPNTTEKQFDNKAEYRGKEDLKQAKREPDSLQKLGTDGKPGTTDIQDFTGELDWTIQAKIGSLTKTPYLNITDVLPEHVNVQTLSVTVTAPDGSRQDVSLTMDAGGSITGTGAGHQFTGTCTKENGDSFYTLRVKAESLTAGEDLLPKSTFDLKLHCKVDDEYLDAAKTGSLTNTATADMLDIQLSAVSQTQNWTKKTVTPVSSNLSKEGAWNRNSQTLNYSVQINTKGDDLQPGSTRLYITDEFTYNPLYHTAELVYELVRSSVKLYEAVDDGSGNLVKGQPVTDWRWTADEDNPGPSFANSKVTKFLRLDVPDGTPLILEYAYKLVQHKEGKNDFKLSASNRIYLNTKPDESVVDDKGGTDWQDASTSGSATTGRGLTITKVEEGNSAKTIANARFQVFRYDTATNTWETTPMTLVDENGQSFTDYVTDSSGEIQLLPQHGFSKNVLYKLVETQSAQGYLLPQPAPSVKFYFPDATDPTALPDSYLLLDAIDLSEFSASEYISNSPDNAKFGVSKLWRYSDGSAVSNPPEVKLRLMRIITEQQEDSLVNDPLASFATVTVKVNSHSGNAAPQTLRIPKGAMLTVDVSQSGMNASQKASANLIVKTDIGNDYCSIPVSNSADHCTVQFLVKYNVTLEINTNIWSAAGAPTYTCTYPGQSSGSSGSTGTSDVLAVEEVPGGSITLNAANGWHWNSAEHPDLVPIRGTYNKNGTDVDVWYSYYVVEESGNYDVSYTNSADGKDFSGIASGSITLTNTLPKPTPTVLTVEKQWEGLGSLDTTEVNFQLIRKEWATAQQAAAASGSHPDVRYGMTEEELAQVEGGTLKLMGTYQLTEANGWKWASSSDPALVLYSNSNGRFYTYFIVEEPGNYQIAYSGETQTGTLTVTNTTEKKPTAIQVEKKWFSYFGDDLTVSRTGSVSFELHRIGKLEDGTQLSEDNLGTFTISQAGNWKWGSDREPLLPDGLLAEEYTLVQSLGQKAKVTYTYFVTEKVDPNAAEHFTVEYDNNDGITEGTVTMKNTLESPKYSLPQTGGRGTVGYTLAGIVLCLGAAIGLTQKRRKGESAP